MELDFIPDLNKHTSYNDRNYIFRDSITHAVMNVHCTIGELEMRWLIAELIKVFNGKRERIIRFDESNTPFDLNSRFSFIRHFM